VAKVFAVSGSVREGSYNTSLLNVAIERLRGAGAEVTTHDFRAHPLPIFNADLEREGYPGPVLQLKLAVREADAVLIAGPEYNAGPTPLLKNAIDWVSRGHHGEKNEWEQKVVGLMSASPGAFGGARAQVVYRNALVHCYAIVLPGAVTLPHAGEAFGEDGALKNERALKNLEALVARMLEVSSKLRAQ
jgi:NAD(P)H-dependent FMN reductase